MQPTAITGLVLAGGRGSRMGGVDKGLQAFRGQALVRHAVDRLAPQVGQLLINANRHTAQYEAWAPVCSDASPEAFAGPLAGFLSGLRACRSTWLCTVPCDTPLFPVDLVARLARAVHNERAQIAMACAREEDGHWRAQPVFCLLPVELADSLQGFLEAGGRKIDAWTAQHRTALVRFDQADDTHAFANANTLEELRQLEALARSSHAP